MVPKEGADPARAVGHDEQGRSTAGLHRRPDLAQEGDARPTEVAASISGEQAGRAQFVELPLLLARG